MPHRELFAFPLCARLQTLPCEGSLKDVWPSSPLSKIECYPSDSSFSSDFHLRRIFFEVKRFPCPFFFMLYYTCPLAWQACKFMSHRYTHLVTQLTRSSRTNSAVSLFVSEASVACLRSSSEGASSRHRLQSASWNCSSCWVVLWTMTRQSSFGSAYSSSPAEEAGR